MIARITRIQICHENIIRKKMESPVMLYGPILVGGLMWGARLRGGDGGGHAAYVAGEGRGEQARPGPAVALARRLPDPGQWRASSLARS